MSLPATSKSQIKKEIIKCGKDSDYFINNYAKIVHPLKGLIPFKTYPFQTQLLKDFDEHRFHVVLKARQLGISTITAAYVTWLMLFYKDKNILVIATQIKTACNMIKKVKNVYNNLPKWLKIADIEKGGNNKQSFGLTNGSVFHASSTSGDAGRSEALSLLVVDEAAHIENMDDLWTGLYPTISTGGRVIALSTPLGVGNWFHKIYSDSENGTNDFFLTTLQWQVHPDHDEEWFINETKSLSKRETAQEYLCSFNASGETVICGEDIKYYENVIKNPIYRTGFDRNHWIWEKCDLSCNYLISADVARGDGKDYSAFNIIRLEDFKIVSEYRGKPSLDLFANILYSVGMEYNSALLVIENNNIGHSALEKLIGMEYPNLYYSVKGTHDFVDSTEAISNMQAIPGFSTTVKTRPLIIAKFEEFARNKLIKTHSKRFVAELRTFVWKAGKPQAMKGYNDDLIMSLAIACWVHDTALVKNRRDINYKKAMLDNIVIYRTNLDTTISGMHKDSYRRYLDKERESKKEAENFLWLYKG